MMEAHLLTLTRVALGQFSPGPNLLAAAKPNTVMIAAAR